LVFSKVPEEAGLLSNHAHAPKHMHDELGNDYRDMIYAATAAEVETRRKAFVRKWRLKCRAIADSLEEAGDRLFTFTRLDPSQWKAARTTNAIERLNQEFRRRIKTQAVLPCAETVPMLLWALLAAGRITMRKVDGWQTLDKAIEPMTLDPRRLIRRKSNCSEDGAGEFPPLSRHNP
jgi:transposase-like protein